MSKDENGIGGAAIAGLTILVGGLIVGPAFGIPAFCRYQNLQEASNKVLVTEVEIRNTNQLVEVEKKRAEVRVAEARGIAESQHIIDRSLTPLYLQYLAIGAQKEMAHSPNHTQIYIPVGNNGIPLVKTVDVPAGEPTKKASE